MQASINNMAKLRPLHVQGNTRRARVMNNLINTISGAKNRVFGQILTFRFFGRQKSVQWLAAIGDNENLRSVKFGLWVHIVIRPCTGVLDSPSSGFTIFQIVRVFAYRFLFKKSRPIGCYLIHEIAGHRLFHWQSWRHDQIRKSRSIFDLSAKNPITLPALKRFAARNDQKSRFRAKLDLYGHRLCFWPRVA
jgi:hypothetical protein